MNDDFPEELDRAYKRIEELEAEAKEMERNLRNYTNIAWWRTYNAALNGFCSQVWGEDGGFTVEGAHARAQAVANLAHGPLDLRGMR